MDETLEEKVEEHKKLRKIASTTARRQADIDVKRASVILGVSVTLVTLVVGTLLGSRVIQRKKDIKGVEPPAPVVQVSEMLRQAEDSLKKFYEANTVKERLEYVAHPESVHPRMVDYYTRYPIKKRKVIGLIEPMDHTAQDRTFLMASVVYEKGLNNFCVCELIDSEMKIDWEVLVNYSEKSWEDFQTEKPTEPVQFRVRVNPASYYNFEFDEETYLAFQLKHPETRSRLLYGYLKRDSESYDRFVRVRLMSYLKDLPVLVRLRYPSNPKDATQVEIVEFDSFSWVRGIDM